MKRFSALLGALVLLAIFAQPAIAQVNLTVDGNQQMTTSQTYDLMQTVRFEKRLPEGFKNFVEVDQSIVIASSSLPVCYHENAEQKQIAAIAYGKFIWLNLTPEEALEKVAVKRKSADCKILHGLTLRSTEAAIRGDDGGRRIQLVKWLASNGKEYLSGWPCRGNKPNACE